MTKYLPLFPLKLVAFPNEKIPLHIFEERYQQLIFDCENNGITFGIPVYLDGSLKYGSEVFLEKVIKRYDNGSCDVICRALNLFELLSFDPVSDGKLYAGGKVKVLNNDIKVEIALKDQLLTTLKNFYEKLDVRMPKYDLKTFSSYSLAHKIGLTLEQETELLVITSERKRIEFLLNHLNLMLSTLTAVTQTKELIALNGHFKYFDPLDFTDITL